MPTYDLVIKGGTVIDGLRTPRYKADVGIVDGKVALIGRIDASEGRQVVDAEGVSLRAHSSRSACSRSRPSPPISAKPEATTSKLRMPAAIASSAASSTASAGTHRYAASTGSPIATHDVLVALPKASTPRRLTRCSCPSKPIRSTACMARLA